MINEVRLAIVFPYAQQTQCTLMLINVDRIFDCKVILNDS